MSKIEESVHAFARVKPLARGELPSLSATNTEIRVGQQLFAFSIRFTK